MSRNIALGKSGEQQAVNFLLEKGFFILERNYRYKRGEIDIIARKGNLIVFAEVKLRSSVAFGNPEEAVNRKKERLIILTAENYIYRQNWNGNIRFDIIAIENSGITHLEDAFY